MKILVTGSLGFIFSNFVRMWGGEKHSLSLVGLDKAVYDYNLNNAHSASNYTFYLADLGDSHILEKVFSLEKPDIVIGGAAESFVDNSITDIMPFLHTNVIGTQNLVNACLKHGVKKYVHISTDEVYGQQLTRDCIPWNEASRLAPRNPYACSKAAADLIVMGAHETHGLQYNITRSCNVFGARQKRENLIPHIIHGLLEDKPIRIHGTGNNFRQYIWVNDVCRAIMKVALDGIPNRVYNIGDDNYYSNLEMVELIAKLMGKQPNVEFIQDRKAHDFGYKVEWSLLRSLGWKPLSWSGLNFESKLGQTIEFYANKGASKELPPPTEEELKQLAEML